MPGHVRLAEDSEPCHRGRLEAQPFWNLRQMPSGNGIIIISGGGARVSRALIGFARMTGASELRHATALTVTSLRPSPCIIRCRINNNHNSFIENILRRSNQCSKWISVMAIGTAPTEAYWCRSSAGDGAFEQPEIVTFLSHPHIHKRCRRFAMPPHCSVPAPCLLCDALKLPEPAKPPWCRFPINLRDPQAIATFTRVQCSRSSNG